ncbi:WASH complex subunit 2 isoform X2 [Cephus cinctus]|uniref:WASH complex subunit 2 isoform X2 n=1 Tax=Cephus cinctus TaxID=211228 RepID=A0AAJ7R9Y7_CEPCN|nr:WASH complex subunit 2 isoform X2 [Cephus cinctus]
MDKSWDHPWTTEEIRRKRNEWTLAGDAGLLKHLQQFSEELKKKEQLSAELMANVEESVRQGLVIMDEKYERLEVVASDSEDEEEPAVPSIILRPKDPYQDRPLPYIIGSEKWRASSKIGLESSSSESEQLDEEESDSESDEKSREFILNSNNCNKSMMDAISSSSSEPNDYNAENVSIKHDEKMDAKTEDTIDSDSESITDANSVPKHMKHATPSFAEELAKRLGNMLPSEKSINTHEVDNPQVDQPNKDDIFESKYDDIFSTRSRNLFDNDDKLFNDDDDAPAPTQSSKNTPIKSTKANIIPPSIDVPPPMSSIFVKPKSAIDDPFGDADSEDSDDIFTSKTSTKKVVKKNISTTSKPFHDNIQKPLLTVGTAENTGNMATSTPETIVNANNLFEDEDDNDLFGTSKRENVSSGRTSKTEASNATKKKPVGGIPVLRPANILASEIRSKFRNRLSSSDSSDSNVTENNDDTSSDQVNQNATSRTLPKVNFDEPSLRLAAGNLENSMRGTETSGSSGISIHPPSFNSTTGSGLGADFQPQMSSSRLRSEEIYRERVISDSLFVPQTHKTGSASSGNITNSLPEGSIEETSDQQDVVFDNEDIFGPPPLPKAGPKTKSKVISLFDDSDSGDDLFSNTSSGSRSQKSADLLVTTPQTFEKSKPFQKNNLFDDDDNIFSTKDSPDVDIFNIGSKTLPQETHPDNKTPADSAVTTSKDSRENSLEKASSSKAPWTKSFLKPTSIFDDSDDDEDLFGTNFGKKILKDNEPTTAVKVNDTEDLFSVPPKVSNGTEKKELLLNTSSSKIKAKENLLVEKEVITNTNKSVEIETKESSGITTMDSLRSGGRLFDDVDNDDVDDLFGEKSIRKPKQSNSISSEISQNNKAELHSKSINTKEPEVINEDSKEVEKIDIVHHSILPDTKITTLESTEESESSSSDAVPSIVESEPLKKNPSGISESTISDDLFVGNSRRDPPKTLNIRPAVSPTNEETIAPKRVVSGKIKDLMGRMGDLKILSPTDTPPLWRKNDEVTDELDVPDDEDIADGGCISTTKESPQPVSEEYAQCKPSVQSKPVERKDDEVAVSFDEPAQVGTLAAIASKSRIRIQAKRRPQSRHARQSALRESGLIFDTVDLTNGNHPNTSQTDLTSNEQNSKIISSTERLVVPVGGGEHLTRSSESNLTAEDKSERSLSKESSMSINKNTLLSPSTDEEDLFDVPPDLPEDPQKEDLLFGRAPILSPVENVVNSNKKSVQSVKSISSRPDDFVGSKVKSEDISKANQKVTNDTDSYERQQFSADNSYTLNQKLNWKEPSPQENKEKEVNPENKLIEDGKNHEKDYKNDEQTVEERPIDPLNDKSHDPLKDPSQLFAFVTKTPSPEKGKNLLFNEDDSLFTNTSKEASEIPSTTTKKQTLDLFEDDIGDDLFSAPLTISAKKPLRETKISLFDDDDDDEDDADPDSLFSTFSKSKPLSKSAPVVKEEESSKLTEQITVGQEIRFESDDENLFGTRLAKSELLESSKVTKKVGKTSNLKDIFGDQSSGEDDIFAIKKSATKTIASSNSIFTHDDDGDDDIFGKPSSASTSQTQIMHHQSIIKKPVTRDLRKTAEKIVEDPLSLLQKD